MSDYGVYGDLGFFGTLLTAYNKHWVLKTCPEDWWITIRYKEAKKQLYKSKYVEVDQPVTFSAFDVNLEHHSNNITLMLNLF